MAVEQGDVYGVGGAVYRRKNSRYWQLRYTDQDGREIRRSSGTEDRAEALKELTRLTSGLSFREAAVRFFAEHRMSQATRRGYEASLRRWDSLIGHLNVNQINKHHLSRFVSKRLSEGCGTPAIRQDLAFLSSLFTHAMMLPGGPDVNIVRHYPKSHLAPAEERTRFLNRSEAEGLLSKLSGVHHNIVLCALETGMRLNEVLRLMWEEVDLHARLITLKPKRTKTRKGRSIPISPRLEEALRKIPERSVWVFPNPRYGRPFYDCAPWFGTALAQTGITDFRFHDLRHTFASWWIQRGGSMRGLQEILGHTSTQMTKRYSHLRPDHLSAEFNRVWG